MDILSPSSFPGGLTGVKVVLGLVCLSLWLLGLILGAKLTKVENASFFDGIGSLVLTVLLGGLLHRYAGLGQVPELVLILAISLMVPMLVYETSFARALGCWILAACLQAGTGYYLWNHSATFQDLLRPGLKPTVMETASDETPAPTPDPDTDTDVAVEIPSEPTPEPREAPVLPVTEAPQPPETTDFHPEAPKGPPEPISPSVQPEPSEPEPAPLLNDPGEPISAPPEPEPVAAPPPPRKPSDPWGKALIGKPLPLFDAVDAFGDQVTVRERSGGLPMWITFASRGSEGLDSHGNLISVLQDMLFDKVTFLTVFDLGMLRGERAVDVTTTLAMRYGLDHGQTFALQPRDWPQGIPGKGDLRHYLVDAEGKVRQVVDGPVPEVRVRRMVEQL